MVKSYQQDDESDIERAGFNMGLALLKRIDFLLSNLEVVLAEGYLIQARYLLSSINSEIDCFLTDKEKGDIKSKENGINTIVNAVDNLDAQVGYKGNLLYVHRAQRNKLFPLLIELDRTLRKFMHDHNLIMPPESESSLF